MIGVFLDLKKAFDTVTHSIPIRKMYAYGIIGNISKWFESYLADRSQYVAYDGSTRFHDETSTVNHEDQMAGQSDKH